MLSTILKSKKARQTSISIVRAFIKLKQMALSYNEFSIQLKQLETQYNKQFDDIFEAINYLMKKDNQSKQQTNRKQIGFKNGNSSNEEKTNLF
jgi:dimeric dUTPase (all-alpha-NTP-PPase superfamily)